VYSTFGVATAAQIAEAMKKTTQGRTRHRMTTSRSGNRSKLQVILEEELSRNNIRGEEKGTQVVASSPGRAAQFGGVTY